MFIHYNKGVSFVFIVGRFPSVNFQHIFAGLRYIFIALRPASRRARISEWMMKTVMILNVSRLAYSPAPFQPQEMFR